MKRVFDIVFSFLGMIVISPVLIPAVLLVWIQDFHSPFYVAVRIGKSGKPYKMVKLRSMTVNADSSGVSSTSSNDLRITPIGKLIRKFKLDELPQGWHVFNGDMSFVGPRPQVAHLVDEYTEEEKGLLKAQPGITDFSSIVFADENDILKDSKDPDLDYDLLIRPWKSRLGLFYIEKQSLILDITLMAFTLVGIVSREKALKGVSYVLSKLGTDPELIRISKRIDQLQPHTPPGIDEVSKTPQI
jgi:lipopolysaccharide/colanic/teichoic acid biosynthesis glycosyltransferase